MSTTAGLPITAYIRTLNEARLIGEVIDGAKSVASEVVIVDSGSTDDTVAIAEARGAKVLRQDWLGNGRQKRVAEDAARHDWLFDLDADEIVTPALAAEIHDAFSGGAPETPIFRTPMAYAPPYGAPWVGFGGVKRHKLYDRRVVRQPDHEAWDQFTPPPDAAIGVLRQPILHYAFRDTDHLVRKVNANSTTRARLLPPKAMPLLILRIVFGLPFYVGKRFFLDGLFRAGVQGFAFSMISGFGRWLRDVKMYDRRRLERSNDGE